MEVKFIPKVEKTAHLHFQCSPNMTIEQICEDITEYIFDNKNKIYIDKTEVPVYFKRYFLVEDNSLWDKGG